MNINWTIHKRTPLSKREAAYAIRAAAGYSDKQTARVWGTSTKNVHQIAQNARDKFHVYNRTALIAELIRREILTPLLILLAIITPITIPNVKADDTSDYSRVFRVRKGGGRRTRTRIRSRFQLANTAELDWRSDSAQLLIGNQTLNNWLGGAPANNWQQSINWSIR